MERRVVITGMSVITPVGCSVDEFWANLQAGHCGIAPLEGIEEELSVHVGGQVKNFDPTAHGLDRGESRRSDRYSQFAVAAAIEAMQQSGLKTGENIDPARLGVYIGSGIGGMTTFIDQTRVLFEELEHALARGAEIIAEVVGYGNTCDAYHYTAPRPHAGPASRAIRQALEEGGYQTGEQLYVNAHGTSTPLNDKTETLALKLALGEEEARRASISSTNSMTGHMLGATGAVELIASALAVKHGIVPPTIGLDTPDEECDLDYTPNVAREVQLDMAISNSLGFGGHNACVALRRYVK